MHLYTVNTLISVTLTFIMGGTSAAVCLYTVSPDCPFNDSNMRNPLMFLHCTLLFSRPLHKGPLELSKTTLCFCALSINSVTTSNCPGDWDRMIENKKNLHGKMQKKRNTRGLFGEAVRPPNSRAGPKPKTKLVAGIKFFKYALDYRTTQPEHAWGQWWKTTADFG